MKSLNKNQDMIQAFLNDQFACFSPETNRSYKISLSQFFSFFKEDYTTVKPRDIRVWLASLEENGLKPRTINTKLAALKSFYAYCLEEDKMTKNPAQMVLSPKKEDRLPSYLTKRQLALLQEQARKNHRDRAIIDTLYATGVRISELLNIKLGDVKWETHQIWIREGKGNKERFVLFTYACAERLETYLQSRKDSSEYLISNGRGEALSYPSVEQMFKKLSKDLGFKVTPHTLRHTFAAHLMEKGMEFHYIQELLGHVNVNSTRIYTRLMNSAQKKLYDQYQT